MLFKNGRKLELNNKSIIWINNNNKKYWKKNKYYWLRDKLIRNNKLDY